MHSTTTISTLSVGGPAPESRVSSDTGEKIDLSAFWSESPNGAVIVLLRNFGCLFCREQSKRLRDAYAEFVDRHINLVAVGIGTPQDAVEFASWLKLPFPVLGQPDTSIHAAWGLGRSSAATMIDPGLLRAGARAIRSGAMQGKATGDPKQLPGTFIVDQDGIIRWARPGQHPGDNPAIDVLLAAVDSVRSHDELQVDGRAGN